MIGPGVFTHLFRRRPDPARLAEGARVYAIGDVHGCDVLLALLLAAIGQDDAARGPAATTLVFLGDLIDRGPASAQVIGRLMRMAREPPRCIVLMGNHEEVMLGALEGDPEAIRLFDRIGGRATMLSYGVDACSYDAADEDGLAALIRAAVPAEHAAFLTSLRSCWACGDYWFVHAGVRPGRPLDKQRSGDLRWIRDAFLDYRGDFGGVVVHGHTIVREVTMLHNRIAVDTGAFLHGRLSAVGLEGTERWVLGVDEAAPC